MLASLPPALWLLLGAIVVALVPGRLRIVAATILPLLALGHAWTLFGDHEPTTVAALGFLLQPVTVHPATPVFATIFCLMAAIGTIFAARRASAVELTGAMIYAGGALGVIFAGDWLTLFVFWEIMTLGSTSIIFSQRTAQSYGAGMRYFGLHCVGGVLLFAGIACLLAGGDTAASLLGDVGHLTDHLGAGGQHGLGAALVLLGMLVNAGAPPVWSWIADAYPAASTSGTVFLSAFTTKTAVFVTLGAFAGSQVLIIPGIIMALYGIMYAVRENDIRRLLAYAIVSQVGFMLCGIGLADMNTSFGALAYDGVCAQAFAHICYKALLLMTAGTVIEVTGRERCSQLGGLWRRLPVTFGCAIIGVLAMSGLPFTAGWTTKSMMTAAGWQLAVEQAQAGMGGGYALAAWLVLEALAVAVFIGAGMKFLWLVFVARPATDDPLPAELPKVALSARLPMLLFAGLCVMIGLLPTPIYELLPFRNDPAFSQVGAFVKHHYTFAYVGKFLLSALGLALAFALVLPLLRRGLGSTLDLDALYRRLIPWCWQHVVLAFLRPLGRFQQEVMDGLPAFAVTVLAGGRFSGRPLAIWITASMVVGVVVLLLLVEYINLG